MLLDRDSDGILKLKHGTFGDAAKERYCNDSQMTEEEVHQKLANFFKSEVHSLDDP